MGRPRPRRVRSRAQLGLALAEGERWRIRSGYGRATRELAAARPDQDQRRDSPPMGRAARRRTVGLRGASCQMGVRMGILGGGSESLVAGGAETVKADQPQASNSWSQMPRIAPS